MRLCAYWDCMQEVDEGMNFCREHAIMLNRQLIDKCPKCGRYKDIRQNLCPDCNYGRPVAGWKVMSRNLDEIDETVDQLHPEEPDNPYTSPAYTPPVQEAGPPPTFARGEALCPSCGSPNLTYKKTFDYFRCNDCESTFITPVYSYGDARSREGTLSPPQAPDKSANPRQQPVDYPQVRREPPPPAPAGQYPPMYEQPPAGYHQPPVGYHQPPAPYEQAPPVYNQPMSAQPPAYGNQPAEHSGYQPSYLSKEPNLDAMRFHQVEERNMNLRALRGQGKGGKLGWVYLLVVLCIVALAAFICWVFFSRQIMDLLSF